MAENRRKKIFQIRRPVARPAAAAAEGDEQLLAGLLSYRQQLAGGTVSGNFNTPARSFNADFAQDLQNLQLFGVDQKNQQQQQQQHEVQQEQQLEINGELLLLAADWRMLQFRQSRDLLAGSDWRQQLPIGANRHVHRPPAGHHLIGDCTSGIDEFDAALPKLEGIKEDSSSSMRRLSYQRQDAGPRTEPDGVVARLLRSPTIVGENQNLNSQVEDLSGHEKSQLPPLRAATVVSRSSTALTLGVASSVREDSMVKEVHRQESKETAVTELVTNSIGSVARPRQRRDPRRWRKDADENSSSLMASFDGNFELVDRGVDDENEVANAQKEVTDDHKFKRSLPASFEPSTKAPTLTPSRRNLVDEQIDIPFDAKSSKKSSVSTADQPEKNANSFDLNNSPSRHSSSRNVRVQPTQNSSPSTPLSNASANSGSRDGESTGKEGELLPIINQYRIAHQRAVAANKNAQFQQWLRSGKEPLEFFNCRTTGHSYSYFIPLPRHSRGLQLVSWAPEYSETMRREFFVKKQTPAYLTYRDYDPERYLPAPVAVRKRRGKRARQQRLEK